MASITETLKSLGDWSLDLDYDDVVVAACRKHRHVLFYWGEQPIYTGVLLRRRVGTDRVTIGGLSLEWWLGLDDDGPMIEDREYLACTNKLSNPGFELEDLYWRREENSVWTIAAANALSGSWSARVASDPAKDDVLQADEGGYPTRPGDEWTLSAWAKRLSGAVGRLRARLTFEGRFKHVGVFPAGTIEPYGGAWLNYSDEDADGATQPDVNLVDNAGEAKSGHWTLRIGPCTRKAWVADGSFESGTFDDWTAGNGWHVDLARPRTGLWSAYYDPTTGGEYWLLANNGNAVFVTEGERWHAEAFFFNDPALVPDGDIYIELSQSPDGVARSGVAWSPKIPPNAAGDFRKSEVDFEIDPGVNWLYYSILADGNTSGYWYADDAALYRLSPNVARARTDFIPVIPDKPHALYASVMSGPAFISGSLKAQMIFRADGRDDVVQDGPTINGTDNLWQFLEFDFTPPSGYDTAAVAFIGTDIVGDSFRINMADLLVRYEDETTRVYDVKSDETEASFAELTQTVTTPDGAERVQVEIVAEDQADGWVVDDVSITRVGTPAVVADIVQELLVDPDEGNQLVGAGDITGDDTLVYDWHIRNMTNRQALEHLSRSGVADPTREWRVNPDNTLDWGEAEELFEDRTDIVLAGADLVVIGDPDVEENVETRLTRVKVIGAERQLPNGKRVLITGEATSSPGEAEDWFGEPLSRTRLVEDSTVDHRDYASSLAAYHASLNSDRPPAVQMAVSDWRAFGRFDVGDWIYVYKPESGIENLDNPVTHAGATIYPEQQRVLSRTWNLGAGPFRAEIRSSDGTTIDITEKVRWELDTTAQIEVGDLLPEFAADPQGGAAGLQFRRFRGSRAQ